jgi:general stress protein 26
MTSTHGSAGGGAGEKRAEMHGLVEGIAVAMFTTRRPDGHLVSRAMQTQKPIEETDFWFVTDGDSHKLDELAHDPHVNLSYYRDRTREWVSVSGTARIVTDRAAIRRLYQPDWRAWFGDEGGARDGGPDDPRLTLVFVTAESVVYMKNDTPRPVILFEVVKGMVTGSRPDIGEVRRLDGAELHGGGAHG